MSDYTKQIKVTCCCGATCEVSDVNGDKEWVAHQVEKFHAAHKQCLRKTPVVKIPKAK